MKENTLENAVVLGFGRIILDIEYDTEANIWHGETILDHDVITYESKSLNGVLQEFIISMEDYLEFRDRN